MQAAASSQLGELSCKRLREGHTISRFAMLFLDTHFLYCLWCKLAVLAELLPEGPGQFSDFYVMQQVTLIDGVQRKRGETCGKRWSYFCRGEDASTSCKFLALVSPEAVGSCMFLIDKDNAHRSPHSFLSRFVPLISLTQEGDSCWWLAAVMCELLYQKISLRHKQLSTQLLV
jgi:hypothetical protein